jgi:hypothetical protein
VPGLVVGITHEANMSATDRVKQGGWGAGL